MSSTGEQAKSGGIGILGLLGILFIGLKLTHYIGWSWWWVLAPFWGPFAAIVIVAIIGFIFAFAGAILKSRSYKKKVKANQPRFLSDLDHRSHAAKPDRRR